MADDDREGLPPGWALSTIGEVAEVNPKTPFDELPSHQAIPFVPMAAVSEETGEIDFSNVRSVAEVSKGYVRFAEGDVLFAKITPCMENGKVAPVSGMAGAIGAGSTEFHVLRPRAIDQRFLWYWLVDRSFRADASRHMSGSAGQLRVPVDFLRSADLRLPPLAEQRRIVARIDELFDEIAQGEAALGETRKGLEVFRRALLKAAVTGELTQDWRRSNSVDESGQDVVNRLGAGAPVRARRGLTSRGSDDLAGLPQLPSKWTWGRLSRLGNFGRGRSRHRPRNDERLYGNAMPFVQTGSVANAEDYITSFDQSYSAFGVAQSRVWPTGTLCITIAANIAKTAITTFDCCFPDSVVGLVPGHGISAYWVHLWMQTIQKRLERFAPATAQKNINLQVLDGVMVPIPPTRELEEILRRVNEGLNTSRDTLAQIDADAADAARLRQSILKAAFEGRLVQQDDHDEPASVLLARVRRPGSPPTKRARRTRVSA
jgi:type I restriction enzyme S subunit